MNQAGIWEGPVEPCSRVRGKLSYSVRQSAAQGNHFSGSKSFGHFSLNLRQVLAANR